MLLMLPTFVMPETAAPSDKSFKCTVLYLMLSDFAVRELGGVHISKMCGRRLLMSKSI